MIHLRIATFLLHHIFEWSSWTDGYW